MKRAVGDRRAAAEVIDATTSFFTGVVVELAVQHRWVALIEFHPASASEHGGVVQNSAV